MKPVLFVFSLLFSLLANAQEQAEFRFAFNSENKTVLSSIEEVVHPLAEDTELTFTERINLYIATHLDETKILGEDISSTLLTLRFSDQSILQEVSTLGENPTLNAAAEDLFNSFIGHNFQMGNSPVKIAVEYNIPIVIKH